LYDISNNDLRVRSIETEDGKRYLEGYAILFNSRSKLIFEDGEIFTEIIERSALDGLLQRKEDLDVLYTFQHNMSEPMARYNPSKGVQSLTFSVDDTGLKFRAEIPNTTLGNDTYELVRSGVLYETSFIFTVDTEGQRWERDEDGNLLRYITNMTGLYDLSTVVRAAYDGTSTKVARSDFEDMIPREEKEDEQTEEPITQGEEVAVMKRKRAFKNKVVLRTHQLKK